MVPPKALSFLKSALMNFMRLTMIFDILDGLARQDFNSFWEIKPHKHHRLRIVAQLDPVLSKRVSFDYALDSDLPAELVG